MEDLSIVAVRIGLSLVWIQTGLLAQTVSPTFFEKKPNSLVITRGGLFSLQVPIGPNSVENIKSTYYTYVLQIYLFIFEIVI